MFTSHSVIIDWRDLQRRVADLFLEMGYESEIGKEVELAGRGKKEIDVYVTDPNASYNRIYLIECKFWNTHVPQEVVHSFKTVMEEAGANTGFIISKTGFQAGAYDAARFTNIRLLDFEQLQHLYGNEWFRLQRSRLDRQINRLQEIARLHFDQFNTLGFHNNMFFHNAELRSKLAHFHKWVLDLICNANSRWPESYLGPEPVRIANDPLNPLSNQGDSYEIPTVRQYFTVMTRAANACANEFTDLEANARASFDSLDDQEQTSHIAHTLSALVGETPIRVLKRRLPKEDYIKLLKLVMPSITDDTPNFGVRPKAVADEAGP